MQIRSICYNAFSHVFPATLPQVTSVLALLLLSDQAVFLTSFCEQQTTHNTAAALTSRMTSKHRLHHVANDAQPQL
jgi:hypothetical protein